MQTTALVLTSPGQRDIFSTGSGSGRTGSVKTAARLTAGDFFKRILLPALVMITLYVCLVGLTAVL